MEVMMKKPIVLFIFMSITIFTYGQEKHAFITDITNFSNFRIKNEYIEDRINNIYSESIFLNQNYLHIRQKYSEEMEQQAIRSANSKNNWISISVTPPLMLFGLSVNYERMLNSKLSLGANFYWLSTFMSVTIDEWQNFGINAYIRFYPWGKSFFIGIGPGCLVNDFYREGIFRYNIRTLLTVNPTIGFKIDIGKVNRLYLPIGIEWPIPIVRKPMNYYYLNGGIYIGLGYAF